MSKVGERPSGRHGGRGRAVLVALLATLVPSCDLSVPNPAAILGEEARTPDGVGDRLAGVVGDFSAATENVVLYGGLFTDEFIHAGTFATRRRVDERRVRSSNLTVSEEVEVPLHVARAQADRLVTEFRGFLADERFGGYGPLVDLGLIDPRPDSEAYRAFDTSIEVHLQRVYDDPDDDVFVSRGTYARLIEAETMIRKGMTAAAEAAVNDVRGDFHARWTAERFRIDGRLEPLSLSGDTEEDLLVLMDEYAREGWLAGTRQENLRRLVREYGDDTAMDLYPEKPGDQECWPVSRREQTGGVP